MVVSQLIELLKEYDPNTPVGMIDHYGEFHPMDKHNFNKSFSHREDMNKRITVLDIYPPDIGEEPD